MSDGNRDASDQDTLGHSREIPGSPVAEGGDFDILLSGEGWGWDTARGVVLGPDVLSPFRFPP